jgi:hypothetical protein
MITPKASSISTATTRARGEGSSSGAPNRVSPEPPVGVLAPPALAAVALSRSRPIRRSPAITASVVAMAGGSARRRYPHAMQ